MKLIQPYHPDWKKQFDVIQKILKECLKDSILTIEHVGSTSVVGLAAKAIIDIDIVYESAEHFDIIKHRLDLLGYYHNGNQGIPQREAFKRKKGIVSTSVLDTIPHHLYACPTDSPELKRHLSFRNFLRNNDWARDEYTSIKMDIAQQTNQDKEIYSSLKESVATPFIEKILALAASNIKDN